LQNKPFKSVETIRGYTNPVDEKFPPTFVEAMSPSLPIGFIAGVHRAGTDHHRVGHREMARFFPRRAAKR
jgi:hypothetical protein